VPTSAGRRALSGNDRFAKAWTAPLDLLEMSLPCQSIIFVFYDKFHIPCRQVEPLTTKV
jgi:hypothetical protein